MSTQVIESFKYGLDTRRDMLTQVLGSLLKLENAHINPGAMAEKRKAFGKSAAAFPPDTYGLEMVASGLVTFGSKAPGVNGSTSPLPIINGLQVVYQRLQPRSSAAGVGVNNDMTAVLYSSNFNGKAFVIAKFTDGYVELFYDGGLIIQSSYGVVLYYPGGVQTPTDLSAVLANQINQLIPGWLADANVTATAKSDSAGYHEAALPGSTLIMSPAGIHFTPVPTWKSVGGAMGAQLTVPNDQNYSGVAAVGATVAFLLGGAVPGTVDVLVGALDLTGGPVASGATLALTAAAVATAINNLTFVTGYSALAAGANVTVYAPTRLGNFTGAITVNITGGTITVGAGAVGANFSLTLTPNGLNILVTGTSSSRTVSGTVAVSTSGAAGAVTFAWSEVNADGTPVTTPSGIAISPSTTASTVTFSKSLFANTSVTGYFKCAATDAGGPTTVSTQFTVQLEYDNKL